ncbi:MAG: DUF4301 family protein [Putridiphycobacter sp.]
MKTTISTQKEKIINGSPVLNLIKPCRINDGINQLTPEQKNAYLDYFNRQRNDINTAFFIPASGSGSRMFGKLFNYIEENTDEETIEFIEQFLNNIDSFAFFNKLPKEIKSDIYKGNINIEELFKFILNENGLNLGHLPKGLVPFHLYGKFIINPFQEQVLQGVKIANENSEFHFTINDNFKAEISKSINILKDITGINLSCNFSVQDPNSNSFAFDLNHNLALEGDSNEPIRRPAGHGALIENLNQIDSDFIFIKNIDNVQHYNKAKTSIETNKVLGGVLLSLKQKVDTLLSSIEAQSSQVEMLTEEISSIFNIQLSQAQKADHEFLKDYFNRPIRVCGMVKNQGQAGGGPFWVKDENGNINKQIIEKSQISQNQLSILLHASHFNPVILACAVKDYKNQKFNLLNYVNNDLYFVVKKNHKGQEIQYIEQPGLWNGGMHHWLTLFYEIDQACFSPVKTVLDLLKSPHQES